MQKSAFTDTQKKLIAMACWFLAAGTALLLVWGWGYFNTGQTSRQIENAEYIVYLPSGLKSSEPHPLVVLLSPTGQPLTLIKAWQGVAEKYQWVLLASKRFHNGIPWEEETSIYARINADICQGAVPGPVDRKRVIAAGISGGGWGSHDFAFLYPGLISGVVINTGMMNTEFFLPRKDQCPRGKFAVFLASPTDYRYQEMTHDQSFLKDLGWKTQWIEFAGGHTLAPPEVYLQAARWISSLWGRSDN